MASKLQGGDGLNRMQMGKEPPAQDTGGGNQSVIMHHDDGTHSVDGGEPGHLHKAFADVAAKRGEGMHHMTHHDGLGGGFTTHATAHGQEPEAHDHENIEELKGHIGKFFNEEENEGGQQPKMHGGEDMEREY